MTGGVLYGRNNKLHHHSKICAISYNIYRWYVLDMQGMIYIYGDGILRPLYRYPIIDIRTVVRKFIVYLSSDFRDRILVLYLDGYLVEYLTFNESCISKILLTDVQDIDNWNGIKGHHILVLRHSSTIAYQYTIPNGKSDFNRNEKGELQPLCYLQLPVACIGLGVSGGIGHYITDIGTRGEFEIHQGDPIPYKLELTFKSPEKWEFRAVEICGDHIIDEHFEVISGVVRGGEDILLNYYGISLRIDKKCHSPDQN